MHEEGRRILTSAVLLNQHLDFYSAKVDAQTWLEAHFHSTEEKPGEIIF